MSGIDILGTGCYAPSHTLSNDDLSTMVDTSDEWIYPRTGIKKRHISQTENTSELAYQAAKRALENSGVSKEDIGFIIVATCSADHIMPSVACMLQKQLGLSEQVMAFDMNAACTGFVYALSIANAMLATRPDKLALVIGAEVFSKMLDYTDRSTCILFGDGAGAVVAKHNPNARFYEVISSRGDVETVHIHIPGVPFADHQEPSYCKMNGQEVFKFAVESPVQSIKQVLSDLDDTIDQMDYILFHQANARIISSISKRLKIKEEQLYSNIEEYGNTSAASIPIMLDEMNQKGLLKKGMKLLLVGFGAGLTWGTIYLEW